MTFKAKLIASLAGIALTAFSVAAVVLAAHFHTLPVQESFEAHLPAAALREEQAERYWLCELGGYVAVYDYDLRLTPLRVTEIRVASLRRYDQQMFADGVEVAGSEALTRFLEDFGP